MPHPIPYTPSVRQRVCQLLFGLVLLALLFLAFQIGLLAIMAQATLSPFAPD